MTEACDPYPRPPLRQLLDAPLGDRSAYRHGAWLNQICGRLSRRQLEELAVILHAVAPERFEDTLLHGIWAERERQERTSATVRSAAST